ncbi:MAG: hypothetical protein EOT05_03170 [Candidatus Microsaccharimonas sossegonensis]|uniref:Uncharacterized protein n=1 Tax=Candidatus Microsaccharimonas sossegonensis TaxID=2506948 RepID=A0A4Q0AHX6_9BACT|nr:MAG: hypothetical protein EOT05_03170 [Candidatus Microsaccharimonas sossegonensis]
MTKSLSAQRFLDSKEAKEIREILNNMMTDPEFNTKSMYSPAAGGNVLFVDKHMEYLSQHTTLNASHYLSNLRLMTRVRE